MADYFLELQNVTKRYDQHVAVNGVDLHIPRGKIYGLLGPNGAGKTSTIRMITQITLPDEGQITFNGEPLRSEHVNEIGYMPEERGLYKKMKTGEQIDYLLMLKGMSAAAAKAARQDWMTRLGLDDWTDKKITDLSKGMQQKVQFISTVAHNPPLLILDEPFSGLDPVNAQLIEKEIKRLNAAGTTILFSTHRMEQVEELCDRIALFNRGRLILEDDIVDVRRNFQKNVYNIDFVGDKEELRRLEMVEIIDLESRSARVELPEGRGLRELMLQLLDLNVEPLKVELHLPRLQEIFIQQVGKDAPVAARVG